MPLAMRANITQRFLAKLKPGSYDVWDTEYPGLVLRVRPTNRSSYLVRPGHRWFSLGRAEVLTPAQARELARRVLAEADYGIDPMAARRAAARGILAEVRRQGECAPSAVAARH